MSEPEIFKKPKRGRPFGSKTEKLKLDTWMRPGPYSHRTERFKAIAKFFDINQELRGSGKKEITMDAFCEFTKIPHRMVREAESDPEFVKVVQALSKGKISSWFNTMLPKYMLAAERLSKNKEKKVEIDKQFMGIMQTIAEMTNFTKSDLSPLSEMDDKDPAEIVREAIAIGRKFNESLPDQKILEALAERMDGIESPSSDDELLSSGHTRSRDKEDQGNEPVSPMGAIPQTTDRSLQQEGHNLLHGGERDREVGLPDSIHQLLSQGDTSSHQAKTESSGMAGAGYIQQDRPSIDAENTPDAQREGLHLQRAEDDIDNEEK